jgi:hypothetical protein
MINSYSHFYNGTLLGSANTGTLPPYLQQPAAKAVVDKNQTANDYNDVNNPIQVSKPLQNDIYDNPDIELPPPAEKNAVCALKTDKKPTSKQQFANEKDASPNQGLSTNDFTGSLKDVSKKQWVWIAGLTGGLFLLGHLTG